MAFGGRSSAPTAAAANNIDMLRSEHPTKDGTHDLGCHSHENGHSPRTPKDQKKSVHSQSENVMQMMQRLFQAVSVAKIAFN